MNAVAPGMIRTEMTADTLHANEAKYLSRIPLSRIATPREIADVIVFLASERAGYMTGTTVNVSGGLLMGYHGRSREPATITRWCSVSLTALVFVP